MSGRDRGRLRVKVKVSIKHSDNIMIYLSITGSRSKGTSLNILMISGFISPLLVVEVKFLH